MEKNINRNEHRKGIIGILAAMVMWGFLPIYWQALRPINSWVIILYRIVLVFVYSVIAARFSYSFKEIFEPLKDREVRRTYFSAGLFCTINWSTYIYGVNAGEVVQCSLGYYIQPLMICLIGILFFREKVTKYNLIAMLLASLSIGILLFHFGEIPALAIMLAATFSIYAAIKKNAAQPPLISLVYETMLFVPPALIAIIYLEATGKGALSSATGMGQYGLLYLCGVFTLVPLGLFAYAAQRCTMFDLGLLEYVSPTLSLIVGITVLGESVDMVQVVGFAIIWLGLVFFSYGHFREFRNEKKR